MTRQFVMAKLQGYKREVFACIYLDAKHCVLKYEELFYGTIDNAHIHPRSNGSEP